MIYRIRATKLFLMPGHHLLYGYNTLVPSNTNLLLSEVLFHYLCNNSILVYGCKHCIYKPALAHHEPASYKVGPEKPPCRTINQCQNTVITVSFLDDFVVSVPIHLFQIFCHCLIGQMQ